MARFRFDDKSVRSSEVPATGNRIDYDMPARSGKGEFVRGFALRTTAAGTRTFLLVYVTHAGQERRHKIGDLGPQTVTTARVEARRLRLLVDAGRDPFADQQDRRAAAEERRLRDTATLGGLLGAYVAQLRRAKKPSADKVEAEIYRTVQAPFPGLWKKPAADVTLDELVRIPNRLVRAGQWRQAEKTRSYLRAAYTAAVSARGNAQTRDLFEAFAHLTNTARDLGTIERPREHAKPNSKRALDASELQGYWKRIKADTTARGALLRFHLLTGAQRCEQLAKLLPRDHNAEGRLFLLRDVKGRRKEPREHLVPLIADAEAALAAMRGDAGPFLFTFTAGEKPASYHDVREAVASVARQMIEAEEIAASFTPGELRITVETRLQAAGVPKEVRAHLQSHGISGVQDRHYGKHQFIEEKRAALEKLLALLEPPGKVVPLRRGRAG